MTADIATLGIALDSRPVTEGTAALDKLVDTSTRVEKSMQGMNGQMNDTAAIMRKNAEASGAASQAAQQFLAPLQREIDLFGLSRAETEKYNAAKAGLTATTQRQAAALGAAIDAMQRDEQAARAFAASQDQATRAADQFLKKLNDQVAVLGMNAQQLQSYRAAQLGVSDAAAPLIAKLGEAGAGAHGAGKGMEALNFQTVGARRELLVLAHELSQGNYQKFGGSMMVLGEQTGAAGLLFSAAGLAALGLAAAVGGVAFAVIKGALEQKHMNDALVMTGNYAGLTSDSLNNLAHAAVEAGGSIGEAKKVATELAGSGKFTGDQIGYITEATVAWEHATGQSVKSIIKDFESLAVQTTGNNMRATEAISRATIKLDDQYHFLTESIYEQIRALEKEGDAKGASALATETFARVTHDRAEEIIHNLGNIAKAWNGIKEAVGGAIDAAGNWGKNVTPTSEIKRLTTDLTHLAGLNISSSSDARSDEIRGRMAKDTKELAQAMRDLAAENDKAEKQAAVALANSEGVHAASRIAADDVKLQKRGMTELQVALGQYADDVAKVKAANPASALVTDDAVAAHVAAITKAHTEHKKVVAEEISDYEKLMKTLGEKLAVDSAAVTSTEKLTDAEKIRAKLLADLAGGTSVMTAAEKLSALARLDVIDTLEKGKLASDAMAKMYANIAAEAQKSVDAANKEADANERLAQNWGLTKDQIAANELARLQEQMAQRASIGMTLDEIGTLEKLIAAKQRSAAAVAIVQGNVDAAAAQKAAELASKKLADMAIQDWKNVGSSIADSLSTAFGAGGKAIGQMFKAYADGNAAQLRAQKELAIAKKLSDDDPTKLKIIDDIQRQSSQAQLKSYGDMADAAQGFFDAGSRGYEAMGAAAKVMHAAEVELSLVKGVNAVLTQGEGDPYSAFARMAAMAAVVAGLGVAISGGGGSDNSAKDRQAAAGTGSVFGDSSAKSDSIARSIALATANSSIELTHTAAMVASLRAIESSISGLGNLLIRGSGVTSSMTPDSLGGAASFASSTAGVAILTGGIGLILDKLTGGWVGNTLGKISNAIFGGNTSSIDTGITMGRSTVGSVITSGVSANQYNDTKTDGGWFSSDEYNTQMASLGAEANDQFTKIITNLAGGITDAATLLGVGGDAFSARLNSFVVDIGKISLKGLSSDEIQTQLETVFSKLGDDMAQFAVGGLTQFQQVGEGYLETLTRVATDYANLDSILQASGMTFGAVGLSSLAARENLIALAGGIDTLASKSSSFSTNFLSQAEQLAPVTKYVNEQMAALGLSSVTTRDQFKNVVLGLDLTSAAGQAEYVALLNLADAFAQTHAATVDLSKSTQEIADERKDLQSQLDQLTMSSAQLLQKQRDALDASNQALFDQIQLATAAKDAQDAAKTSLGDVISQMQSFGDSAKALHDGLLTGSLSTLTPEQQYAETKRQYESTLALAQGGDTTAQGQYSAMATAFLTASQTLNSGDSQYSADFAGVLQTSGDMANWALGQVDVAQASLDALNAQVIGISDLNAAMLSVADAVNGLPTAFAAAPEIVMPTVAINYSTMGTANTDALVAEIKSLREQLLVELKGRRADAQQQTGDSIGAAAQIQQDAAQTIVDGVGGAIERAASAAQKVALE